MSAPQEITRLGIIAGGGALPAYLLDVCKNKGITVYIAALEGQCNANVADEHPADKVLWSALGSAGRIIDFFKNNDVSDLVLIGSVRRPTFSEIKPDLKTIKILSRIGLQTLGDNGVLSALKTELGKDGFCVHAIQDFCDKLLMPRGVLGDFNFFPEDKRTIDFGILKSQELGAEDIGQAVVVQNETLIACEDKFGTDALIKRSESLIDSSNVCSAILVKTCKPQQDTALDLPTIGVNTVQNAYEAGINGIVVQAGYTLLVDPKNIAEYANKYKMFVLGVDI